MINLLFPVCIVLISVVAFGLNPSEISNTELIFMDLNSKSEKKFTFVEKKAGLISSEFKEIKDATGWGCRLTTAQENGGPKYISTYLMCFKDGSKFLLSCDILNGKPQFKSISLFKDNTSLIPKPDFTLSLLCKLKS